MLWQKYHRACKNKKNPITFIESDFIKYPVSIFYDYSKDTNEYGVTDKSILSFVVYYLKKIYENEKYLQTCLMCGNAFKVRIEGMTTYCSDVCKKESGRENKRHFDERAKQKCPYVLV